MKPVGSLFDKPRLAHKISRPVSVSERNKLALKPTEKPTFGDEDKRDDEYYEEYDDTPVVASSTTTTTTKAPSTTRGYVPRLKSTTTSTTTKKPSTTTTLPATAQDIEYYDDEYYDTVTPSMAIESTSHLSPKEDRAALFNNRFRTANDNSQPSSSTGSPSVIDNFRLNRFKSPNEKTLNQTSKRDQKPLAPYFEELSTSNPSTTKKFLPSLNSNSKKFANQQTQFESTTTETPKLSTPYNLIHQKFFVRNNEQIEAEILDDKDQKSVVRVVKRPFLPSRGGNPYKGRGLQPVGPASQSGQLLDNNSPHFTAPDSEVSTLTYENPPRINDQHLPYNQQPFLIHSNQQYRGDNHKTTLEDIYNEEYDVELNDALNPMLKPLTSSRGISGFSFSSLPNDEKDGFKSQSQQSFQKAVAPQTTSTSTTTTVEPPQYEYEDVEYEY